jgi:hypothetical protein
MEEENDDDDNEVQIRDFELPKICSGTSINPPYDGVNFSPYITNKQ